MVQKAAVYQMSVLFDLLRLLQEHQSDIYSNHEPKLRREEMLVEVWNC